MHDPTDPEFVAAAKALCELAAAAEAVRNAKRNAERRFRLRYYPDADRLIASPNAVGVMHYDGGDWTAIYRSESAVSA